MERNKLLTFGIGIVAVFVLAASAVAQQSQGMKTLQFGWLGSQTGWCSSADIECFQGAQVARDIINERGGLTIKGQKYKLELVTQDTKCTTDGTVSAATKMVEDQHIKFLAGLNFWYASAVKEICDPANVVRSLIFTCNSPGEMGPDTPYDFLANNGGFGNGLAVMNYMKQYYPQVKKVVVITPDAGCRPYTMPPVMKWLGDRGIAVVGKEIAFKNETTDYSPVAAQVAARKEADAIFMFNGLPIAAGNILKGMREQGDNRLFAWASGDDNPYEMLTLAGKAAANNVFGNGLVAGAANTPPLLAEMEKRVAKYGHPVQQQANGFNSVWTMAYAINKAQSLDPVVVKETWEKLNVIETVFGNGSMGGLKMYGNKHGVDHPMSIFRLDNGELKFAAWVEVHTP